MTSEEDLRATAKGESLGKETKHKQDREGSPRGQGTTKHKSNLAGTKTPKSESYEQENKLSNEEGAVAEATMFELIWYDTTKMYLGFMANALL